MMDPKMTIIFPQVPKCGGTTVQKQLESITGPVMMDYDHPPSEADWHRRRCERRNAEFGLLDFSPFALVFGHFPIVRYQSDKYRYVTLVRDPIEQIFSQYRFLKDRSDRSVNINARAKEMAHRLENGDISFHNWAVGSGLNRIYKHCLDYWPKERFCLIGDTSNYSEFTTKLSDLIDIEMDASRRERAGAPLDVPIDDKELRMLRNALSDEYRWYDDFVQGAL